MDITSLIASSLYSCRLGGCDLQDQSELSAPPAADECGSIHEVRREVRADNGILKPGPLLHPSAQR